METPPDFSESLPVTGGRATSGLSWRIGVAIGLWLAVILTGSCLLLRYSQSAGVAGSAPGHWPETTQVARDHDRPTLVMFVHPHCPCSRATIGELEQLMARSQGKLSVQVWFLQPVGMPETWVKTDLWLSAEAIPGVTVHRDEAGIEAHRFLAATSGQTMLYDRDGSLLFQGGITLSRGHSGDNPGRDAITALLAHTAKGFIKTPVFGCALSETECLTGEALCKH